MTRNELHQLVAIHRDITSGQINAALDRLRNVIAMAALACVEEDMVDDSLEGDTHGRRPI